MDTSDEPVTKPDLVGWTPQLVFWNTVGTIVGGVAGIAALVVAAVALLK
jgi:hypothetical protein